MDLQNPKGRDFEEALLPKSLVVGIALGIGIGFEEADRVVIDWSENPVGVSLAITIPTYIG